MSDEHIKSIVRAYERGREREKARYQLKCKNDPEFQKKNRDRAKLHYSKNKDKKKSYYDVNRDVINAKSLFKYYKKQGRVDHFKSKFPDRHELIKEHVATVIKGEGH